MDTLVKAVNFGISENGSRVIYEMTVLLEVANTNCI